MPPGPVPIRCCFPLEASSIRMACGHKDTLTKWEGLTLLRSEWEEEPGRGIQVDRYFEFDLPDKIVEIKQTQAHALFSFLTLVPRRRWR